MAWTANALDYSYAKPSDAAFASMARGGVEALSRYAWDGSKGLTTSERDRIFGHGLGLLPPNYEAGSGFMLGGSSAASAHVPDALRFTDSNGFPERCPVVYSMDRDLINQSDFSAGYAFLDRANVLQAGHRPVGAYGEIDFLRGAHARGLITWAWPTLAWRHGQEPEPWMAVYQFSINAAWAGNPVDLNTIVNRAVVAAAGWFPDGHALAGGGAKPVTPSSTPHPSPVEAAMFELIELPNGQVFAAGVGKWHLVRGRVSSTTSACGRRA